MIYLYGRAVLHPIFLDELRVCRVEVAESERLIEQMRLEDGERITIHIKLAPSDHAAVKELASQCGGALEVEALPVEIGVTQVGEVTNSSAKNVAALTFFHEYGLIASRGAAQKDIHARALERLSASWARSIRQMTILDRADPEDGPIGDM
ncbi:hypothetical protein [Burkholderia arboris]|uniref:hypothetical protein n=1 Tax=Burkholderia arboris TaxID=488730 RepID=UPI001CF0FEFA|nr:hypothetical protein [Burkholderia arboris]MCA8050714.1 hypothetical protein [Burkholderia arboris]CAJ6619278.1 Uncharacterised protein [Burkholderia pseudomallei]CAJ6713348.1 Uncharacterised protein [Burkholderia pseudomallei]HEP6431487.1 hypothetical protein [Burkholderia cenocepacia]